MARVGGNRRERPRAVDGAGQWDDAAMWCTLGDEHGVVRVVVCIACVVFVADC